MSQKILADLTFGLETALQPEKVLAWLEGLKNGKRSPILGRMEMECHHSFFSPLSVYLNEHLETAEYTYRNRMHQSLGRGVHVLQKKQGVREEGWKTILKYTPPTWVLEFCYGCGAHHKSSWWDAPDHITIDQAIEALYAALPEDTWLDTSGSTEQEESVDYLLPQPTSTPTP